jgi:hypothetical protein
MTSREGYLLFSLEDILEDFCGEAFSEKFGIKIQKFREKMMTSATFFAFQNRNGEINSILEAWRRYALNDPEVFTDKGESEKSQFRHDQTILSVITALNGAKVVANQLDTHYSKNVKSDHLILALRNRLPFSVAPGTLGFRLRRKYWLLKGRKHA